MGAPPPALGAPNAHPGSTQGTAARRVAHNPSDAPRGTACRRRPPWAATRGAAAALACLLALLAAPGAHAFTRSDWTLPSARFDVAEFAPGEYLGAARELAVSGASKKAGPWIVYVGSKDSPADVLALVDRTGRGRAHYVWPIAKDLPAPSGVAWSNGSLFIATLDSDVSCKLYRLDKADNFALGKKTAAAADLKLVLDHCPPDGHHGLKFIRFGPDGKLYIAVGAPCNTCELGSYRKAPGKPLWRYGSLYSVNRDGSNLTLVATGIRNTVGFDWHPATGQLFFTDNGRDEMGDNKPDCELNMVRKQGDHFGFPNCHTSAVGGPNKQPYRRLPGHGASLPDPDLNPTQAVMKCNGPSLKFWPPVQAMGPHVAPLGMRFYRWFTGAKMPQAYDKSVLIAQHGSWNRADGIGARVMRVKLNATAPTQVVAYLPLLTGGVPGDTGAPGGPAHPSTDYRGRPVDIEALPDGSLLVSDDSAGSVYRIWYTPSP